MTDGKYPLPPGFNGSFRAMIYRWFSGQPMNGHRYTDATGFRYGTMATDLSGRASSYKLLPGFKRFLYIRLPAMLAPFVILFCWFAPWWVTPLAALLASALCARSIVSYVRTRKHRRDFVEPVGRSAAAVLRARHVEGMSHTWVTLSPSYRDRGEGEEVCRINLPPAWIGDDGDRTRMAGVIQQRLQLSDISPSWAMHGAQPHVSFSLPPRPPGLVTFEQARADIEAAPEFSPLIGYGARMKQVHFSLKIESPHLLIAAPSQAGKSELVCALMCHFMRHGYGILVFDAKFISHMWLRKVPQVRYMSESEDLHDGLLWLDAELLRRARFVSSGGDPETLVPILAILEEMNGASNRLRSYWKTIKEPKDPAMSPALTSLNNLASMGRELKIHAAMIGQSMTGKASGGPETRENFGARMLGRGTTLKQWRMLAAQIKKPPMHSVPAGRWNIVIGEKVTAFQVPFMNIKVDEQRLIDFATGSKPIPDMNLMMMSCEDTHFPSSTTKSSDDDLDKSVTLGEYSDQREDVTLGQLQNWRTRYRGSFPESQGARGKAELYKKVDLDIFVIDRMENAS